MLKLDVATNDVVANFDALLITTMLGARSQSKSLGFVNLLNTLDHHRNRLLVNVVNARH